MRSYLKFFTCSISVAALSLGLGCDDTETGPESGTAAPQNPVLLSYPLNDSAVMPIMYWTEAADGADFYRIYHATEEESFHLQVDSILPTSSSARKVLNASLDVGPPGGRTTHWDTPKLTFYADGWNRYYVTAVRDTVESRSSAIVKFHSDSVIQAGVLQNQLPASDSTVNADSVRFSWDCSAPAEEYFIQLWRLDNDSLWVPVWRHATTETHASLFESTGITYYAQETHQLQAGSYAWWLWAVNSNGYGFAQQVEVFRVSD